MAHLAWSPPKFELKFPCTDCSTLLKVTKPELLGKKIRCPQCQAAVPVPGGSGGAKAAPQTKPAPRSVPRRPPDVDESRDERAELFAPRRIRDEEPQPKKRKSDKKPRKQGVAVSVVIFLFALAYLGGIFALYLRYLKLDLL